MAKRYIIDPILLTLSSLVCVFCLAMAVVLLSLARPGSATVFGVIAVVFASIAATYGATVEVDKKGVRKMLFGRILWEKTWEQIGEVGVCGTRLFKDPKSKNVGSLYLYFSEEPMDENGRFDMVLKWPPRKKCYLLHRYDRLQAVQLLWDKKIETYNAGDFSFGEGLKN